MVKNYAEDLEKLNFSTLPISELVLLLKEMEESGQYWAIQLRIDSVFNVLTAFGLFLGSFSWHCLITERTLRDASAQNFTSMLNDEHAVF